LRFSANDGNAHPMITPITIAIIIHDVSETRLSFRKIMPIRIMIWALDQVGGAEGGSVARTL